MELGAKPLELPSGEAGLTPLRVYIFNCTHHASERRVGDYRIQLRLPRQQRRTQGELVSDGESLLLLVGYVPEFDVFVLWDAYAHTSFPYSKGVQVAGDTIHEAAVSGIAEQLRTVRTSGYKEVVIAIRADQLPRGVELRRRRTRESLLAMNDGNADRP